MSSALQITRLVTYEEYLTQEREAEFRSEFLCGEIVAMAGGSPKHNVIINNIVGELYSKLKGTPCNALSSETKVTTKNREIFSYPDILVVCGEKRYLDGKGDVLLNPTVLIEVLSPRTASYDRKIKFAYYKHLDSFREYVLVSQFEPSIELFTRQNDGSWTAQVISGLEAAITLSSISTTIQLADIYDRIEFDESRLPLATTAVQRDRP